MKPDRTKESYNLNLFEMPLGKFINVRHELVILANKINWQKIESIFEPHFSVLGRKAIPTRMILGIQILQYIYALSDEKVCEMWVENPYFQYFCGEKFFRHEFPIDRSSISRWRARFGADYLDQILQETLAVAHDTGALDIKDVSRVSVDTTVQEKAVDYPSEVKLYYDAITDIGREAKKQGLKLKQNYRFIAKEILIKASGYAHARQINRVKTATKRMKNILFKLTQRLENAATKQDVLNLSKSLAEKMSRYRKIMAQTKETKDKILVWHAPEVECIAKGKARTLLMNLAVRLA